jgi:predicted Zn-dependent protease
MRNRRDVCLLFVLVMTVAVAAGAGSQSTPVLAAMEAEMTRSMEVLGNQPQPPYFISYEIIDSHQVELAAQYGTVISNQEERSRRLDIDLRVGSHQLDSSHEIRGDRFAMFDRSKPIEIPVDDDPAAIRSVLWYHTDKKVKQAQERFTKVKTNVKVKVEEEDQSADFSQEEPATYIGELQELQVDHAAWQEKLRRYTRPFAAHGDIFGGRGSFTAERELRWFVSSEGSRIRTSRMVFRLILSAYAKADDGMELPRYESFFSYSLDGLPTDQEVAATVQQMIADLQALRVAPVAEPYTGPAILSGRASAVFFHEIFGHRVEGQSQRQELAAQTFKKMVGKQVLPGDFSVIFDPTLRQAAGTDLAGFYRYDNQGVEGQRVTVVDRGTLNTFLMSRKPIEGFASSNGHGRKQVGREVTSRQSNLVVEAEKMVSREALRQMLIERIKEEEKPFGLLFEDIQGGITLAGRFIPNSFNVIPVMVYRIFPDGREELVRGVDLIGTPLTAFSKIVAADDQVAVFNGMCGAESGWVPVSGVSPGILVGQIEVQKKVKSQERPPLLPPPGEQQPEEVDS